MSTAHFFHKLVFLAAAIAAYAGCATGGDATDGAAGTSAAGAAGAAGASDSGVTDAPGESSAGAAQGDAQLEASPDVSGEDVAVDSALETSTSDTNMAETGIDQSVPDAEAGSDAPIAWDAPPEGIVCGAQVCSGPDVCCAVPDGVGGVTMSCMQSCPDGGAVLACDGPEDCSGSFCCASIHVAAGTPPNCPLDMASAACNSSCFTNIPATCPNSGQVRLCHFSSDCDADGPYCCRFEQGGTSATFCVQQFMTALATACY